MISVWYNRSNAGPAGSQLSFDRKGYFHMEKEISNGGSRVHILCRELSDKVRDILQFDCPTGMRVIKEKDFSKGQNPCDPHTKAIARQDAASLCERTKTGYLNGMALSELVLL